MFWLLSPSSGQHPLCLLGMSLNNSSSNCGDPVCKKPQSPVVPRQGNLESKGSRADLYPMESTFEAVESSFALSSPLFPGGPSWQGPGMSMMVGAVRPSSFLEHTRLFRVLFFCMWSHQPQVPVSPSHCMAP